MTVWGKILYLLGIVEDDDLDWILYRVKDLEAEKRLWGYRFADEVQDEEWIRKRRGLIASLRADFNRTRIHRIHGWTIYVDEVAANPGWIQVWLRSSNVDVEVHMNLWVYDYGAFLKACHGQGGLNLDELNWGMQKLTKVAQQNAK